MLLVFFLNPFPPQPQSIPLRPFQTFSKIRGDVRSSRLTTGVVVTGGNLPPVSLTSAANLPPVSLTPVANLPPVSTTQVKLVAKFAASVVDTGGKFATGVADTGGQP